MNLRRTGLARTRAKTGLGLALLRIRAGGRRRPIIVSWTLTHRCNLRCEYCDVPLREAPEADTEQALALVDQMAAAGTRAVSITGGEPLIRTDIGTIVAAIAGRGMLCSINSNGTYLPRRREILDHVSRLQFSLDGPPSVHDSIRGEGNYAEVQRAVGLARAAGVPVVLSVVLTRLNLDSLDQLIETARSWGVRLNFHPVGPVHSFDIDYRALQPTPQDMRVALARIVAAAERGAPILGSPSSCAYLRAWPEAPPIPCFGARAMAKVGADGRVFPCAILEHKTDAVSVWDVGFADAFDHLRDDPLACSGCHCTKTLQLNRQFWDGVAGLPFSARALLTARPRSMRA